MSRRTNTLEAALSVRVQPAALGAGVASGSISAFNWARWEYMLGVTRRKEQWRAAVGRKVMGSHVVIFDTNPKPEYRWENVQFYDGGGWGGKVGGSMTGRWSSNPTANEIHARTQQYLRSNLKRWHDTLNAQLGGMIQKVHDEVWVISRPPRWARGEIKQQPYHERTTRWRMSNMTGLGRLPSGTSLSVPGHSRRDGNKSKRGWLSKTPRKSMA